MKRIALFNRPGSVAQQTKIVTIADVAGSLNNLYFHIFSTNDAVHYVPWLNVNGAGTDPLLAGTSSIEVALALNDPADTVASALSLALGGTFDFGTTVDGNAVYALNGAPGTPSYGASTPASDGAAATHFTITTPILGSDAVATAPGAEGTIQYDANFIYVCVAPNTWKRRSLTTW